MAAKAFKLIALILNFCSAQSSVFTSFSRAILNFLLATRFNPKYTQPPQHHPQEISPFFSGKTLFGCLNFVEKKNWEPMFFF
jgi:hypothetical protein